MAQKMNGKVFLLLAGSGFCTAFGGLQSIALLEWIQPILLLQFLHHIKILDRKWTSMAGLLLLTLATQTLGCTIAYAAEFNSPFYTLSGVLISCLVSFVMWVALLFTFLTALRYQKRFPGAFFSHPLAFACVWTTIWHCESSFAPIGAYGNPSYSQHGIQPMVLTISLWGLDGTVFFMALTASLIHQRLLLKQDGGEKSWMITTPWFVSSSGPAVNNVQQNGKLAEDAHKSNKPEVEDGVTMAEPRARSRRNTQQFISRVRAHDILVNIWSAILLLSLMYSGVRQTIFAGNFFEKGIEDTVKPSVGVSCILSRPRELSDKIETPAEQEEFMWHATSERARAGDMFIVWSEAAMAVDGTQGEEELFSKAREILSPEHEKRLSSQGKETERAGPYLGLSYAVLVDNATSGSDGSLFNVFTLLLPDGSVGFRYLKAHPVPFLEGDTIPGPGELKAVDTPFGRVSGAICFDFEFPRLLEQAAYLGADIVLQPSWTWGPMAKTEMKSNAFRAVESGFTLVRCSYTGESGVVTPYNEVIDLRESVDEAVVTMQLPITPRLWTLYPYGGFLLGILIALVATKYIFMAWLPMSWVYAVSNIFPGAVNNFFAGDYFVEETVRRTLSYRRAESNIGESSRGPLLPE